MKDAVTARALVRHLWHARAEPYMRSLCADPLNVQVPQLVFDRLRAASYNRPILGHHPQFALVRDFGHCIRDGKPHCIFLMVWHSEQGAMRPSRLVVCRDDIEVIEVETDLRLSHLHCDALIKCAAETVSAMVAEASVLGHDTGHEIYAAQAAIRRSADAAMRRYRRRG